jgi:3-hydroxyacyl-CoA dehydrogenase/enoyl-CoA hydratase/3-hydroxybutyryl-CoA epimerase
VFTSGKPSSFLAGADVSMLEKVTSSDQAAELSRATQRAFSRLANGRVPVVAAIHGPCLGGGLELALACHGRVCSDARATALGLPEVQLGLLPGAGGTQRLPRLVGIATALDLMLTGRHVRAAKAQKMGLVDEVVPLPILVETAKERARALAATHHEKKRPLERVQSALKGLLTAEGLQELALEDNPLGRKVLFQQARKTLRSKTHGNYPGPEKIIDVVEIGMDKGMDAGLEAEARAFGELVVSPEARQLMNIFFATVALKKDKGTDAKGAKARPVRKVGVLGAGLMGSGIAYVSRLKAGAAVRLKDKDDKGVAAGLKSIHGLYGKQVKRRSLTKQEATRQLSEVTGTTTYDGFAGCDVVIEAVFEDLALKHRMVEDVEAACGPGTIFGSNTSSIPITRIAEAAKRKENVIGLHYFSPVDKMPLLEIIVTEHTAPDVIATCVELGKKQGKTVIVVRDGVGFYTSRILGPYMNEAAHILSEGVPVDIDRALVDWGYPVGPMTLLDEVGIDVAAKVGPIMLEAFGDRIEPPRAMERLVSDGRMGRKNEKGLYRYENGKKKKGRDAVDESVYALLGIKPDKQLPAVTIAERCALLMVNEAALCLEEGILRSPRDGDIGAIFGLGFPPFRGGPFRYVDAVSAREVVGKLRTFEKEHGKRFTPAPILARMAERNEKFYS